MNRRISRACPLEYRDGATNSPAPLTLLPRSPQFRQRRANLSVHRVLSIGFLPSSHFPTSSKMDRSLDEIIAEDPVSFQLSFVLIF